MPSQFLGVFTRALPYTLPAALLLAGGLSVGAPAPAPIDAKVFQIIEAEGSARVWIHFDGKADLSGAEALLTKEEKGRFVMETLGAFAEERQAGVRRLLDSRGVSYHAFWITNALVVDADAPLLRLLAARPEVERITPNLEFPMLRDHAQDDLRVDDASAIEWNVTETGAPKVWAQGFTGQGVVVASADTGVDWDHPAIVDRYRGNDGRQTTHDYHWFDGTGSAVVPLDDNGHGTFTTGQMVGEDGTNQIGVAPGAQWIACKNMGADGYGSPETYMSCFEWFIAPTDTRGRAPDPTLAPDVINNSWGCPPEEGCDKRSLLDGIQAVNAAGILQIFSSGNSGPGCGSVEDPPGTFPEVLTVGAYDQGGSLAGFSSRGPSAYDRGVKPDVSAPGVSVRSSVPGGGYSGGWSGTSMAAPEVAAAAALVWSANPALIGDIEGTREILEASSRPTRGPRCGGNSTDGNNLWGHGKLDAAAAVAAAAP